MAKTYTTPYGDRFKVRKTIDNKWNNYDKNIAKTHLSNFFWGYIL